MVRVIVFALIALGWWLAAPDRFTAGARTASGAGLRAAGTGARAHWNGGRDGRALGRTARRDRWGGRVKGAKPHPILLGLEQGAVIAGKAVKGAGKLGAAAVRPVPGAVRDGWRKGQDRHRARTAGRPVPVALDPPWWRRPDPQDSGTAAEDRPKPAVGTGQAKCSWTTSPFGLSLFGIQKECGQPATVGPFCSRHDEASARTDCADCLQPMGTNPDCSECTFLRVVRGEVGPYGPPSEVVPGRPEGQIPDWDTRTSIPADLRCQRCNEGRYRYTYDGVRVCGPCSAELDRAADHESSPARAPFFPDAPDGPSLDSEADIRARNPKHARISPDPLTEGQRRFWHLRDRGYPGALDQDGWPAPDFHTGAIVNPMPYLHQQPVPATATTNGAPVTTWQAKQEYGPDWGYAMTRNIPDYTPTTGGPMPAPTELRTHVAVQDFAQQIARLSESSDFVVVAEKARTVGAQSRAGGFGGEMDLATDSLEETARRFAASVDSLREQAAAYGKTSLSVQGS